jgi:hypothetical protein
VGAPLRRSGGRQEEPVSDDRLDHRPGTPAGGHGPQKGGSGDKALGRSRGGLSTKIHLLADEVGLPVAFRITPGQAAEYAEAICLLEAQRAEAVIADKGYDSAEIVATIEGIGAVAVIRPGATGNSRAATIAPCTNSAIASNAASTGSSSSAASAHDTAETSKPSDPAPPSHAPGSDFSYMWIPPRGHHTISQKSYV